MARSKRKSSEAAKGTTSYIFYKNVKYRDIPYIYIYTGISIYVVTGYHCQLSDFADSLIMDYDDDVYFS